MEPEALPLAQMVAPFDPAPDVTDLDTARRLVTYLRNEIAHIMQDAYPVDGEHTVVLDADHERMVQVLYRQRKLVPEQEDDVYDEEYEFDAVFLDLVYGAIEIAWDLAREVPQGRQKRQVIPSA
jgi:hypothetical protein